MKKTYLWAFLILLLIIAGCGPGKDNSPSSESPVNEIEESTKPEKLPPQACYGKLTEDKVRIRSLPGLDAEIIGNLTLGEEVQVLCRTGEKYTVSAKEDYWYVIKRNNGMVGWTFGYYIGFNEPVENTIFVHYVDITNEQQ